MFRDVSVGYTSGCEGTIGQPPGLDLRREPISWRREDLGGEISTSSEIAALVPSIAVNVRLGRILSRHERELTATQLLAVLILGERLGEGVAVGELARELDVSLPGATAVVYKLEGRGLLFREQDRIDRRVVRLRLSREGKALLGRLRQALEGAVVRALEGVDESTRLGLLEATQKVSAFGQRVARIDAGENSVDSAGSGR